MPLRNRVTPFGDIVAVPGRGLLMGNRGVLHDAHGQIVRDAQVRRWIACRLEFRARHRELMQPDRYTELFFLDEAAALAAGHRPCAECRHADYLRFRHAWQRAFPKFGDWPIEAVDRQLDADRRFGPWRKRTFGAPLDDLPAGTFVALDDRAWLVEPDALLAWSPDGYVQRRARPEQRYITVAVLTPAALVEVIRAGYEPMRHPSAKAT
ncbi:MAG TPA: hypothetical protein VFG86_20605 [Chloroflexota bacterium]|nr:hypothetical protein [Chloroflexota bacterium]